MQWPRPWRGEKSHALAFEESGDHGFGGIAEGRILCEFLGCR